jgi:hypothetical protein
MKSEQDDQDVRIRGLTTHPSYPTNLVPYWGIRLQRTRWGLLRRPQSTQQSWFNPFRSNNGQIDFKSHSRADVIVFTPPGSIVSPDVILKDERDVECWPYWLLRVKGNWPRRRVRWRTEIWEIGRCPIDSLGDGAISWDNSRWEGLTHSWNEDWRANQENRYWKVFNGSKSKKAYLKYFHKLNGYFFAIKYGMIGKRAPKRNPKNKWL